MYRLRLFLALAVLIVATLGLASGCSSGADPDGSLVTSTVSSGDGSGSDTTKAPATTEAPATTGAPVTTQAPSGDDSASSSDTDSSNTIWFVVIVGIILIAIIAWLVGRGSSTTTVTETAPPPPPTVDDGDGDGDEYGDTTGGGTGA